MATINRFSDVTSIGEMIIIIIIIIFFGRVMYISFYVAPTKREGGHIGLVRIPSSMGASRHVCTISLEPVGGISLNLHGYIIRKG